MILKKLLLPLLFTLALNAEPETYTPKNVLLICVDDLRPELKSFGVDYIHSPNIDRLANSGRAFHRHYVNAPTCGASRYSLLTGQYGSSNNQALFTRAKQMEKSDASVSPSLPEWFRKNGYKTVSVGKVSHHPGGWGGEDWYDNNILEMPNAWDRQLMPTGQWKHPRGAMHSLAHGEIKPIGSFSKHKVDAFQSVEGKDTIYHDGLIGEAGVEQLKDLSSSETPFFLAIGFIKPHLPFGSPARYMEPYKDVELPAIPYPEKPDWPSTWHGSGEFFSQYHHYGKDPRTDADYADKVRRHYAACVSYVDKMVGHILETLEASGKADETIVVLWGDHGWNLGEHSIWGKHNLFEEALRAPLIIATPNMKNAGEKTEAIVETTDIFPTLCELNGLPFPDFVHGESLVPILENPDASGHPAYSYWKNAKTIRTETHRFTLHEDGYAELYDHTSPFKESLNIADQNPQLVESYKQLLQQESSLHQTY
ncbi:sulfatase [Pelagicoccus enzymogenes]|uniref:sulfatase n=1 Tax=Pelagicoccus enzymogenes TaxID=2773457 RepID=UPI00280F60CB|nr:sulfatase [Pelagicoccus enzymogenes]MDQ8197891.1 sulfatase [Pelagicoccus enzymogenes]